MITVAQLIDHCKMEVLCAGDGALDCAVTGGCCGDLLSWVMSHVNAGDAWMTVMGNVNAVGVASLADAACIVLTDSAPLDDIARARAETHGVTVLRTKKNSYETAIALSRLLDSAR